MCRRAFFRKTNRGSSVENVNDISRKCKSNGLYIPRAIPMYCPNVKTSTIHTERREARANGDNIAKHCGQII